MHNMDIFHELSEHVTCRMYDCNEAAHLSGWFESKQHRDYDLWFIQEGTIEIRVHEYVHVASEGSLVLFSPNVAYTATTSSPCCRFTFVHFDFCLGDQTNILDNFQLSGIIPQPLVQEEAQQFMETYHQYARSSLMSGIRLKGCLTILIAKIMERYGSGEYTGAFTPPESSRSRSANLTQLQPVLDQIQSSLHQPIRIGQLASTAGMSEKYFFHYFKQAVGLTPGQYIYQLKMNRARDLLYSKQYSIHQVSTMLGYPDPYSFSKAFKKYYKIPPSQFGSR